jgi:hypothetical protein
MGRSAAVSSSSSRDAGASGDTGEIGLGMDGDDAMAVHFTDVVRSYVLVFELQMSGSIVSLAVVY